MSDIFLLCLNHLFCCCDCDLLHIRTSCYCNCYVLFYVRVNCFVTFAYSAIIWSHYCCVCHLYYIRTNCCCKCQVSSQLIPIFVVTCYIMSYLVAVCCHKKVIVIITSVYSAISEHNAVETITSCAMSDFIAAAVVTCCAVSQWVEILDVTSYMPFESLLVLSVTCCVVSEHNAGVTFFFCAMSEPIVDTVTSLVLY